jgi:hypothetical protein
MWRTQSVSYCDGNEVDMDERQYEELYRRIVPHYRARVRVDMGYGRHHDGWVAAGDERIATIGLDGTGKYVGVAWEHVTLLDSHHGCEGGFIQTPEGT